MWKRIEVQEVLPQESKVVMSELAERLSELFNIWNTTHDAEKYKSAMRNAGLEVCEHHATILAALAAAEEAAWVRKKLGLPADATTSDVYGQMHILTNNAHGYVAYIKAGRCEDKSGEIARLSVVNAAAAEEVERLRAAIELATGGVDLQFLERSTRCLSIEVPLQVYRDAVQPLLIVLGRMRELRAALSPPAANAGESKCT